MTSVVEGDEARGEEFGDASRRTFLANERTYLAWWRTGLTALAVALGAGKIVPSLTDAKPALAYVGLGAGFGGLGVALIAYGLYRTRAVERTARSGGFAHPQRVVLMLLSAFGIALGTATVVVLVVLR